MNVDSKNSVANQPIEIDLIQVGRSLWSHRLVVGIAAIVSALLSLAYAIYLQNIFVAEAILFPADAESQVQSGSQLVSAASLAGISLNSSDARSRSALATLESREFINKFIDEHDLKKWLFASYYDDESAESVIDRSLYDTETGTWLRDSNPPEPSQWASYNEFMSLLNVSVRQSTGLIEVSIEYFDPQLAAHWVNLLIADINRHVKEKDMGEARRAIDYLQGQLERTNLIEMQRVFYQLIESQTRVLMLADVREGYVFEIIDPAVVPETKSEPNRAFIAVFGTLIGVSLTILFLLLREHIKTTTVNASSRSD